jgi:3-oxoadipate enol-lactonase
VLAIAGSEDHVYPPPISGRDIATAAGGTDVTVNAAGHSLALEQATVVAEHLAAHFATAG